MAETRLHFLGGFLVERGQRAIAPIPSALSRSLFAYLVTNRDRAHARDYLAGTFWPENTEASARRRLSQALWRISTAFGEEDGAATLIEATADVVAFNTNSDYWLDVEAFDRHIANATRSPVESDLNAVRELESAVGLYKGDFLPGFYDDWTMTERHRLQRIYLESLNRLIVVHKSAARYESAVSYAQRLALQDPLREEAHREVMRLNLLLGRTAEALHQYEVCESILVEELGTQPDYETRELQRMIASLRDKGDLPFAPPARTPLLDPTRRIPMVGREAERRAALRRIEDTLDRRGGVILLEGEEGVGKSRLVEELVADAQWRGLSPLAVECRQNETRRPLRAIGRIIDAGLTPLRAHQLETQLHPTVLAEVARVVPRVQQLLPDVRPEAPQEGEGPRQRLHDSIRQCLLALADLNPIVAFVDDFQWIDNESAALLAELCRDLSDLPLTVCLSYRSFETRQRASLWKTLVGLDTGARAERIGLQPLTEEQVSLLVRESVQIPMLAADLVEGLQLETGGNPLFILETLRAWNDESGEADRTDSEDSRAAGFASFPISGGVSQVIARRIERLSDEARTLADTAAVAFARADIDTLTSISGLDRVSVINALEQLVRRGIMSEDKQMYRFTHDQVRRVVLDTIEIERRKELHLRTAEHLQTSAPDLVEELAFHFGRADVGERAHQYAITSGRQALQLGAFETAVRHFEEAAGWDIPEGRWDFSLEWEDALDILGRRDEQAVLLDELEALAANNRHAAEVKRRRARLLASRGNYRTAKTLASEALESLGTDPSGEVRARVLRTLGLVTGQAGNAREAVEYLEAAVAALAGHPHAEAGALSDLGDVLAETQDYSRASEALLEALERHRDAEDLFGVAEASGRLAIVSMEVGDVGAAVDLYGNALEAARTVGYRRGIAVNLANLGNALYVGGSIGDALRRYDEAAEQFEAIGDRRGAAVLRANRASVRFSILGDDSIAPEVETSLAFFQKSGPAWGEAFCHEHLAALAHRRGDMALARRHVEQGLDRLEASGHLWVEVHLRRLAAAIELEDHRLDDAGSHLERALEICRDLDLKDVLPTIQSLAAMVLLAADATEDAREAAYRATRNLRPGVEQPYLIWHRYHRAAEAAGHPIEARAAALESARLLDRVVESLPDGDRDHARRAVPEHRAIAKARGNYVAERVRVVLPSARAPLGRPLRDGDWTEVEWTIRDPSDYSLPQGPERRRARLLRIVAEAEAGGAAPRVRDLAESLEVSTTTIRRDLADLRAAGRAIDTRGSR